MMIHAILTVLAATLSLGAQDEGLFHPYKTTEIRMPSVPIFVNDPYFSIWSPYDRLTDGPTEHWTHSRKPVTGLLRVDGALYRFLGPEAFMAPLLPTAEEGAWEARISRTDPGEGWTSESFDDRKWQTAKGAFGSGGNSLINTRWGGDNTDIYVRRTLDLSQEDAASDLYLYYSHDDVFELYLNGTKVVDTGNTWRDGLVLRLDGELAGLLKPGRNVIAAHCHNTVGGAFLDYGIYKDMHESLPVSIETAEQLSLDVMATSTYCTFTCGPVLLDVVFTAPMMADDLDLVSTPVNIVSYQIRSQDRKKHDVQLCLGVSAAMAINTAGQPTATELVQEEGLRCAKTGTVEQPILAKKGDSICIDWGYFYLPAINGEVGISSEMDLMDAFASSGKLPAGTDRILSRQGDGMPVLSYVHDFGKVKEGASFALVGYDEVYDIEYMYHRYKGYWARNGKTLATAFHEFERDYASLMERCKAFDARIYDDAFASGGRKYADILSGTYRHVMAAHKLFEDKDGNLLFFSKENNSNGCVNTVDLTYPSAPLFLLYNPELEKAMMTSIFEYSRSGRWTKPFAAHDLGTYPIANGQVYGEDMPLEEAGNMVILAAMLSIIDGNTSYADRYWDILTTWADYLVENGMDPADQLCTDDFAGRLAHNCNLAVKAIMGIAGYAEMLRIKGEETAADSYMSKAREMAGKWEELAREGDHYRLTYDQAGSWSQKYNMVWDKLWGTGLFTDAMQREMLSYLPRQNRYGLSLDSRAEFAKSDWIMWTAAMASDREMFQRFLDPLYNYVNETPSRVPVSDLHDTNTSSMIGMYARSVIGGYWMRVLVDRK